MRKGIATTPVLAIVGSVIAFVVIGYFAWQSMRTEPTNTNTTTTNTSTDTSLANSDDANVNDTPAENTNTVTANTNTAPNSNANIDPTAGWSTYTNNDVGYSIKHPNDWTVAVTDEDSVLFGTEVKYITVTTPTGDYALYLGVKDADDTFRISGRTGVGAGDFESAGQVTIAGTVVTASKLVFQGEAKEWYGAPNGPSDVTIGTHKVNSSFSYTGATSVDTPDIEDIAELETGKMMLGTLTFIP